MLRASGPRVPIVPPPPAKYHTHQSLPTLTAFVCLFVGWLVCCSLKSSNRFFSSGYRSAITGTRPAVQGRDVLHGNGRAQLRTSAGLKSERAVRLPPEGKETSEVDKEMATRNTHATKQSQT